MLHPIYTHAVYITLLRLVCVGYGLVCTRVTRYGCVYARVYTDLHGYAFGWFTFAVQVPTHLPHTVTLSLRAARLRDAFRFTRPAVTCRTGSHTVGLRLQLLVPLRTRIHYPFYTRTPHVWDYTHTRGYYGYGYRFTHVYARAHFTRVYGWTTRIWLPVHGCRCWTTHSYRLHHARYTRIPVVVTTRIAGSFTHSLPRLPVTHTFTPLRSGYTRYADCLRTDALRLPRTVVTDVRWTHIDCSCVTRYTHLHTLRIHVTHPVPVTLLILRSQFTHPRLRTHALFAPHAPGYIYARLV